VPPAYGPVMKPSAFAGVLAVVILAAACGSKPPSAGPSPTPSSPPSATPPSVLRITVAGNISLTTIGETSQLTATAQLSDGTTQDVSAVATWTSTDPVTLEVSSRGMVTVRRYGAAYVYAAYVGKQSGLTIRATPAGTFITYGRVREPGSGSVSGATIATNTGVSMTTGSDGTFSLGALTGTVQLSVTMAGFEPATVPVTPDEYQDVAIQRIVRVNAGQGVSLTLAPHDMDYAPAPGVRCYPCRLIRVSVASAGVLELAATWTVARTQLNIWVKDASLATEGTETNRASGTLRVTPGELQVYVGMPSDVDYYIPLTFTTTIR
jgi:hypothetical protein